MSSFPEGSLTVCDRTWRVLQICEGSYGSRMYSLRSLFRAGGGGGGLRKVTRKEEAKEYEDVDGELTYFCYRWNRHNQQIRKAIGGCMY